MSNAAHRRLDRVETTAGGELDPRLLPTLRGYFRTWSRLEDSYRPSHHYRVFGESPNLRWVHLVDGSPEGRPAETAREAFEANLNAARDRFGSVAVDRAIKELGRASR